MRRCPRAHSPPKENRPVVWTLRWAASDWLARWQKHIVGDSANRYCDRETGEEIGWIVSPFLDGFYYGYRLTREAY